MGTSFLGGVAVAARAAPAQQGEEAELEVELLKHVQLPDEFLSMSLLLAGVPAGAQHHLSPHLKTELSALPSHCLGAGLWSALHQSSPSHTHARHGQRPFQPCLPFPKLPSCQIMSGMPETVRARKCASSAQTTVRKSVLRIPKSSCGWGLCSLSECLVV